MPASNPRLRTGKKEAGNPTGCAQSLRSHAFHSKQSSLNIRDNGTLSRETEHNRCLESPTNQSITEEAIVRNTEGRNAPPAAPGVPMEPHLCPARETRQSGRCDSDVFRVPNVGGSRPAFGETKRELCLTAELHAAGLVDGTAVGGQTKLVRSVYLARTQRGQGGGWGEGGGRGMSAGRAKAVWRQL